MRKASPIRRGSRTGSRFAADVAAPPCRRALDRRHGRARQLKGVNFTISGSIAGLSRAPAWLSQLGGWAAERKLPSGSRPPSVSAQVLPTRCVVEATLISQDLDGCELWPRAPQRQGQIQPCHRRDMGKPPGLAADAPQLDTIRGRTLDTVNAVGRFRK